MSDIGWAVRCIDGIIYLSTVRTEKKDSIAAFLEFSGYSNDWLVRMGKKGFISCCLEETWEFEKKKWGLECIPIEVIERETDERKRG